MHMDVAELVMPVRVSADNRQMTRKLLPAKSLAKFLRLIHGQPVVRVVQWVEADGAMVTLNALALLVFAIAEIGAHTGNRKIIVKQHEE